MAQALARTRSETALRLSETRWRSIFETSTLAITVFDQNLRYTATNPAFQTMLGYTDEELRQLTPLDITVADERGKADSRLTALREGKIDHYVVEKQYLRKDGTVIWGQASVARASQSGPEMFIGTMIDITEIKRAQDSLFATQSELARVAQLTTIGQMAAAIAHEIKQPLTSIMMGSSAGLRWLAKKPPNLKEVRACFDLVADNGDRANQVIDSIRAMFQKGRQEKELVDINQLVRETWNFCVAGFRKSGSHCRASWLTICRRYSEVAFKYSKFCSTYFPMRLKRWMPSPMTTGCSESAQRFAHRVMCWFPLRTPVPVWPRRTSTASSIPSSRQNPKAWAWVYRYVGQLSKLMKGVFRRVPTPNEERSLRLHCLPQI